MKVFRIIILALFISAIDATAQVPSRKTGEGGRIKTERVGNLENGEAKAVTPPTAKAASPARNAKVEGAQDDTTPKTAAKGAAKGTKTAGSTARPSAKAAGAKTNIAYTREFPTAAVMPDDAAWRRDIYRTIDLTQEANACLYYPVVPTNGRQNLFVYLFRQILRGNIHAYEYTLDANEHFDDEHLLKGRKIMDTHNIYYENNDGKIRVNDADLPSEDVKLYFIKESVFYDQHTASFRTKVTAICPVMVSGMNDFGEDESQRVPLFWVKYEEAAPYLAKLSLMGSSINNASAISCDDYFTMNRYKGDIYKTTNLQDRIIAQYAEDEDAQAKERDRIEGEMSKFQDHLWGHTRDSLKNVFGNAVEDAKGVVTYDEEGHLVDALGRRIAFALADSVSLASPDNLSQKGRMVTVLVNERGFAVDENGEPLLNSEGKPIEITYDYPDPEGVDGPNVAAGSGKKDKKTTTSSAKTTSKSSASPSRRGASSSSSSKSSSKSSSSKSSAKTKSTSTKAKAPSSSKSSGKSSSGGLSVRRERH